MMTALAETPTLWEQLMGDRDRLGGERTLDDVVVGAWEALSAQLPVACPVCDGELAPEYGAHASPVGGRCLGCRSELL
jgi:hypothetical protein